MAFVASHLSSQSFVRGQKWLRKIGLADKWRTSSYGHIDRPQNGQKMRRPRKNHPAEFKAKVTVAALKGDKTFTELAEKLHVHTDQIAQW